MRYIAFEDFQKAADIYGGKSLVDEKKSQYAKVEWPYVLKHRFSASLINAKVGV